MSISAPFTTFGTYEPDLFHNFVGAAVDATGAGIGVAFGNGDSVIKPYLESHASANNFLHNFIFILMAYALTNQ